MRLLNKLTGYEEEHIPNSVFHLLSFVFAIRDILFPIGKRLEKFDIRNGLKVVDYGCGPGSYIEHASQLIGDGGRIYAVDVHPLAIKSVMERVRKKNLKNVVPILSTGYPVDIESHSVDIIYALDMFHHVKDVRSFLKELHRLIKLSGTLFIESGHQSLDEARQKILKSNCWAIVREEGNMFKCRPNGGCN